MIRGLDHIALAVRRIEDHLGFWGRLGLVPGPPKRVDTEGVRVLFLPFGDTRLELLEPLGADTPVGRFLARRGEGLHHLCFRVGSLREVVTELERGGVKTAGGIRPGADGRPVTFLHPRDTGGVLVELIEDGGNPDQVATATPEPPRRNPR